MKKMPTFERSVFIPDLHAPYIDELAFSTALNFTKFFRPEYVFVMGDVIDFYQLSKFSKNPARQMDLQLDLDQAFKALRRIRAANPNAKMYLLKGNHEYRLTKYLWTTAAELLSLRDLTVPHLLSLQGLDIEYVESGSMMFHGFLIKHGNVVRARSGYTATGELEKAWVSGCSGHTHRLSSIYKTNYAGTFTWTECGCLSRLDPEYAEGQVTDWQHGLACGFFESGNGRFEVHTLPIIKGRIVYDGHSINGTIPHPKK